MKKINIDPKLAGGIVGLIYYFFFILLEIITDIPFFTSYWKTVTVGYVPLCILVYHEFDKAYKKDAKTDNKIFIIIEMLLLVIMSVIGIVFL